MNNLSILFLPAFISLGPFHLFSVIPWVHFHLTKKLFQAQLDNMCDTWYTNDWRLVW
jgi:hypothetical protein